MKTALALLSLLGACAHRPVDEGARQELERFSAPADARSWYLRGLYAESEGDLVEARRAMDWAVRLDRPNAQVWLARARFAQRHGEVEAAILDATAAVERAPGLPEARLVLGTLLVQAGRSSEAVEHLELAPPCAVVALLGAVPRPLPDVYEEAASRCVPGEPESDAPGGWEPVDGSRGGWEE